MNRHSPRECSMLEWNARQFSGRRCDRNADGPRRHARPSASSTPADGIVLAMAVGILFFSVVIAIGLVVAQ